ncbi:EpsG family protein [Dokdonia donghaensis]|uniref:EpsG family protein n=1 Tax=Dokdonia donghaensis TaxID=326320 RepID=UPI001472513E|nr:EpsG family protein [Dokdonia donghaensis]
MSKIEWFKNLTISVLIIFLSIRYEVGNDYAEYYNQFEDFKVYGLESYFEPFFILIYSISPSFQYVIILTSILSLVFIHKGINYFSSSRYFTALFIFFSVHFVILNIHLIRQGISVAIIFFAFKFLFEGNKKKFIIWCLIASGFHSSSLVVLLLYPLYVYGLSTQRRRMIIFIISILLFITIPLVKPVVFNILGSISITARYASVYQGGVFSSSYGLSLGILADIVVFLVFNFWYKNNKMSEFILILCSVSIFISLSFNDLAIFLRLGYYFKVMYVTLMALLLTSQYRKLRIPLLILITLYGYNYIHTNLSQGNAILDYQTIFEDSIKFITY